MRFSVWVNSILLTWLPLLVYAAPKTIPVFITNVKLEPFAEQIEALGTLRANEALVLSSAVTETITVIHFNDGQRVKAGDILVEMTSAEEHALLEEARFTLDEAERQFKRVQALVKSNLVSKSLLDQRRVVYETAQAKLQATQSRLADRLIIAPFSGVVGLRNISVGSLVEPGDPITTLDDDRVMKLDIAVPALFLDILQPGLQIQARSRSLLEKNYNGKIVSVDSRINPVTRSIIVRALLPNDTRQLKPGMLMTVRLSAPVQQQLMLPEEALVQEGFNRYAFVVKALEEPSVVEKRKLVTGARTPGAIVVESGLAPGEWVVTHGVMRLNDGSAISIIKRE
ncbi:efflux RND transporter periplasmic adaptor subunit [Zooshikella marina]|uniref:efflux RND transporter periplasmic adaptor subunit n=1 Tax=Zooshikella ganghwensis TaxID=202772 RepID=UPI001BAEC89B|nr:efflux RND transporter periplasmic adaptor subunit [Zooshikella ganghwensis]MBU2705135.1 efflux RND transporter periplasmic adaptor subunit [Zooshikella ganghwensis]